MKKLVISCLLILSQVSISNACENKTEYDYDNGSGKLVMMWSADCIPTKVDFIDWGGQPGNNKAVLVSNVFISIKSLQSIAEVPYDEFTPVYLDFKSANQDIVGYDYGGINLFKYSILKRIK